MKRLYRSRADRVLGGVCGGLGEYFGIDPVIVRLILLVLVLFGGSGLLLYLIALAIIPNEPEGEAAAEAAVATPAAGKGRFWWGLILIVVGVILWGSHQPFFYWSLSFVPGVHFFSRLLVPLILVVGGIYLLYTFGRRLSEEGEAVTEGQALYRSRKDRKIGGVCAGLAEHFKVDVTLVRVIFVAGAFFYLTGVLLYLVLLAALPEEPFEPEGEVAEEPKPAPAKKETSKARTGQGKGARKPAPKKE